MSLIDIFNSHKDYYTDKWEQYIYVYDMELKHIIEKGAPLSLLEVGIANGGSLQLWERFLPQGSKIYGIDINPYCENIKYEPPIELYIGDAGKEEDLNKFFGNQQFDIIIDDGSHICPDTINNFYRLFPRLKNGGIYIVEDVIASYGKYWKGGFRKKNTTVEFFKGLADAINFDHVMKNPPRFFNKNLKNELEELNKCLASVAFYDSMIVLKKYNKPKEKPFRQIGAGLVFPVAEFPIPDEARIPLKEDENLFT
ncbi:class I SAM-dependent methyltransferase [bacterium]|nr:class I SAM-dependent methyltransferase [bacterium]